MAATMLGSLLVSLGLESGEFRSGLQAAEKDLRKSIKAIEAAGAKVGQIGRNLTLGVTLPLAAIGAAAFKTASDLAELEGAFDVTFGSMAQSMREWAEETGDTLGRSTQEIQASLVSFQELFSKAFDPAKAAEMSKQFAVLTQDLASIKNLSNDVAQQKLFSGLVGEAEPLRAVGVLLSETAVKAKGAQLGIAGAKGELSEQSKVAARAALIQEQLANANGDVVRTFDNTANQIKRARASFEELQAIIGGKLIPAITPLISGLADVLTVFTKLPESVQTGLIGIAAFTAILGPAVTVIGAIVTAIRSFMATAAAAAAVATAAGTATTTFAAALTLLRTRLIALIATLGPYGLALAGIAGVIYLVTSRTDELTEAEKRKANETAKAAEADRVASDALQKLASATKQQREEILRSLTVTRAQAAEALRAAKANIEHARSMLAVAKAAAQSEVLRATRTTRGAGGGTDPAMVAIGRRSRIVDPAQQALDKAEKLYAEGMGALEGLDRVLKDASAPINLASALAGDGKKVKSGSGPSAAEISQRFNDELSNYAQQTLSARQQLAKSAEEAADLELRGVELARIRTIESIKAEKDYSAAQKARLIDAVENLAEFERQGVEFQKQIELERDATEMMQVRFDNQRDLLQNDYAMADTQAERKRLALQILDLEHQHRRNQLEMIINSKTAGDAEKRRAEAILASLADIQAGERASVARGNETAVERYMRDLNKTPAQINEAIDEIQISGLQSLNDQLADAIVNFKSLGDVAKNVIKSILTELIRLQLQKAIIGPLANMLGLGGGSAASGIASGFAGFSKRFGGARAKGGPVTAGKVYLTSEDGPELFQPGRSGRIISNRDLSDMQAGAQAMRVDVVPSPYFNVVVDGRADRRVAMGAPGIATAAASGVQTNMRQNQARSLP